MDEFTLAALTSAFLVGALAGIFVGVYGAVNDQTGKGILGFFACLIAGVALGLIGAVPTALVFAGWIAAAKPGQA